MSHKASIATQSAPSSSGNSRVGGPLRKSEKVSTKGPTLSNNSRVNETREQVVKQPLVLKRRTTISDAVPDITQEVIQRITAVCDEFSADPKVSYLKDQFLSKFCDESLCPITESTANAFNKLFAAEERNAEINEKGYQAPPAILSSVLQRAQRLIADCLGDFDLEEMYSYSRFSGGATTSRPRRLGAPVLKYAAHKTGLDITRSAIPLLQGYMAYNPKWAANLGRYYAEFAQPVINVVSWNKVGTVPKKSDCRRVTASEPDLNQFFELGIGMMIKKRLRRKGVNLFDQKRNKHLARWASLNNLLATIDLSSASDLNNQRLIWDLIPTEWFEVMSQLRCRFGKLPNGKIIRWEMFSSMGNGFTFELESLIFWALAKATTEIVDPSCDLLNCVSVYGDDIIVPGTAAADLISVLYSVGHRPNQEKTFVDGPFRESCGGHYHYGNDITPFYIREPLIKLTGLIRLGNQIRKWSNQVGSGLADLYLVDTWKFIKGHIPKELWGGRDLDASDSLYTGDKPYLRLKAVRKKEMDLGEAILLSVLQPSKAPAADVDESRLDVDLEDELGLDKFLELKAVAIGQTLYSISQDDVRVALQRPEHAYLTIVDDAFQAYVS